MDDFDIDLNIDFGGQEEKISSTSDISQKEPAHSSLDQSILNNRENNNSNKYDISSLNYEEEWLNERKRHEITKEKLFTLEDEVSQLKSKIEKLEKLDSIKPSSTQRSTPSDNNTLQERVSLLEEELRFSLGAAEDIRALKSKSISLVERIRVEKQERARAETDVRLFSKKIDLLSVHIEKLMLHLKHEAAAKVKAMNSLRRSEYKLKQIFEANDVLNRKVSAKDRLILELREGSKILEDQLRLMDEKYLEIRTKLDYARSQSQLKLEKAEKTATSLRVKWAIMGNSKLLDYENHPAHTPDRQDFGLTVMTNNDQSRKPRFSGSFDNSNTRNKDTPESVPSPHRGSMRKRGLKIKRINMKPTLYAYDPDDKEGQELAVIEKIKKKNGQPNVWTEEKLRNLIDRK